MTNTLARLALAACTLLALAACGSNTDTGHDGDNAPELPAADTSSSVADTAPAKQTTNERGFIVKQLGEMACFGGAGKDCDGGVSFAIDSVDVDPQCPMLAPSNGAHAIVLHLRIATGADAKMADRISGVINPFSFVEIGKDGITRDAQFGTCSDSSAGLPDTFGPNQQYQGVMDLEVPEASGTIALQLGAAEEDGQRGWEWAYPAGQ
ncbi:hypothetical protein [Actinophytocola sp.]|uniref:hypothetical protein n=1 Tax=Actinophytocola sp. TaxID=1872138 RepID=UPI002D6DD8CB|nr:hypothetical protein [Actinophytocola sp.]HYQ69071.1 hypothetical protein [Actinophytocola sp.]